MYKKSINEIFALHFHISIIFVPTTKNFFNVFKLSQYSNESRCGIDQIVVHLCNSKSANIFLLSSLIFCVAICFSMFMQQQQQQYEL